MLKKVPEIWFSQSICVCLHLFHDEALLSFYWLWFIMVVFFNEAMHLLYYFHPVIVWIWNFNHFIWIPGQTDILQIGRYRLSIFPHILDFWTVWRTREMNLNRISLKMFSVNSITIWYFQYLSSSYLNACDLYCSGIFLLYAICEDAAFLDSFNKSFQ